ncbi:hypothetical protein CORT_0F03380 [Candida orthopsilosis Co 90-125]|uniref:Zn(2)-C6 fungal-type domain-containing protein n=1 Tax=Candida orthopsilosis (strain 90-125) TaxID=1136231 RepID=H8X8T7_CANO9|nr:hypothetical protein CORT_0F03380 [Candida orthopsilosis Co 90-125]CCG24562.1 hypothetical protein CORT_0F03380 [Candida orthopsilosis Co 90-125]
MPTTKIQSKRKRSRNGCLSCKQMKIKCNEAKPSCEYCIDTGRACVYATPISKSRMQRARKPSSVNEVTDTTTTPTSSVSSTIEILDSRITVSNSSSTSASPYEEKPSVSILCGYSHYEPPPNYVDHLTRSLVLNQASTMLGLSRFELRLLKFFDNQCVYMFSFGVNEGVHHAWKYKVPQLFMESELVRQSMFSFAAVALSSSLPLPEVQSLDNEDIFGTLAPHEEVCKFNLMARDNIYLKTTAHFLDTLNRAQEKIQQVNVSNSFGDPFTAKELKVSSILIFAMLGLQPYGLIKLISFDEDEETDLVKFSKSTRDITLNCASTLLQSEIRGLLYLRVNEDVYCPRIKECDYPIIKYLLQGLYEFQDSTDKVLDDTSHSYQTLQLTLDWLTKALFSCRYYRFPLPLFRFLQIIPDYFRTLLYAKHPYALKVLYVYASLCFIARFQMFKQYNIWRDFIVWYESEMGLNDNVERNLYHLVVDQCYVVTSYEEFPYFDPVEVVREKGPTS